MLQTDTEHVTRNAPIGEHYDALIVGDCDATKANVADGSNLKTSVRRHLECARFALLKAQAHTVEYFPDQPDLVAALGHQ